MTQSHPSLDGFSGELKSAYEEIGTLAPGLDHDTRLRAAGTLKDQYLLSQDGAGEAVLMFREHIHLLARRGTRWAVAVDTAMAGEVRTA